MNHAQKIFCEIAKVQPIKTNVGLAMEELFLGTLTKEIMEQRMAIGNFGLSFNRNTTTKQGTTPPPEKIKTSNCCDAIPDGELDGNIGRCSKCKEMAEF